MNTTPVTTVTSLHQRQRMESMHPGTIQQHWRHRNCAIPYVA